MVLIRPRLTDYYDIALTQAQVDFAIPLLDEDIPLFVDPFLLWKSKSLQDNALHTAIIATFDRLLDLYKKGNFDKAIEIIIKLSECQEVGLGSSAKRTGKRIGKRLAKEIFETLVNVPQFNVKSIEHIEVLQLIVEGIGRDRICDFCCSIVRSFLIDYTIEQCRKHSIPMQKCRLNDIYNYRETVFESEELHLPISPSTKAPILLVPKRWLRYSPWIDFEDYFKGAFIPEGETPGGRSEIITYNRHHFDVVEQFLQLKEQSSNDCLADPIFAPISILSAKRKLNDLKKLTTGLENKSDKKYEDIASSLLASTLFPYLDFNTIQSRTISGALIRDMIFYNSRSIDFLQDIHRLYDSRQLVFELKNTKKIEREHINQLNRYLNDELGRFGVLVTRNPPPQSIKRNIVDLWSGQRRCIICITDQEIEQMVTLFESKQRQPIEVLKWAYIQFTRSLPS